MEDNEYRLTIDDEREFNQMHIDAFVLDFKNDFDYPVDQIILKHKKSIVDLRDSITKLESNPENRYEEDGIVYTSTEVGRHFQEIEFLEDELFALSEMKIIYAYKQLEYYIKRLITIGYEREAVKRFTRWENLMEFFKAKKIPIKEIVGYQEINQLRIVNNYFKHYESASELKAIPEFSNKEYFSYSELELFYDRIEKYPELFINSVSTMIYDNLYKFDNQRLDEMAESFALRMDKETAKAFSEQLLKQYE
nr:hypothetical protein [uncultured Draconibacterium sp.]